MNELNEMKMHIIEFNKSSSLSNKNRSLTPPLQLQPNPKKKINRVLASCFGCRKRKTRCDRDIPCSECFKRNLPCDYSGAVSPSVTIRRNRNHEIEREDYVKSLEARLRALEQQASSTHDPPPTPLPEDKQDFSVDDLAAQLSTITIGQRVRCDPRSHRPHPLQAQVNLFFSAHSALPRTTFIQPDQQFSLNLVASNPIPSLEELCKDCLPTKTDIEFLAEYFFNSINLWSSCLNPIDWKAQLDTFWSTPDRLQFRPSPPISEPPHLTQHSLAHFVSTIYGVLAHGLLALADIHHLDSATEHQSNPDSSASSPSDESLWNLTQAEKISLSNRWFRFSLGLLISPLGDIYVRPTIFGIRAMSILANVELAPENTDHGVFFWTLTDNLAISAGLHREPPITDDEDLETLDEAELESRRCLFWHITSLDWAGHSISAGIRLNSDPDQFSVKLPGTVPSTLIPLHPVDGWPLDPLVCVKRACAVNDCLMHKATNKINNATYQDVLEMQARYLELDKSIPPRLQCQLSVNGKALEPVVENNPIPFIILAFLRVRFCVSRIRLLRLFIFPKKGVPPEEQSRQLEVLLQVSKLHFLGVQQFSHTLNMHPLLMYSLINTAVACALTLLINHQTRGLVIDEDFFLPELNKVIDLFNLGKKTMAATMASKAASLLQTLVRLIKARVDPSGSKSFDGRKKGPGVTLIANQTPQAANVDDEVRKRKKQSNLTTAPVGSSSFQHLPYELGIPSDDVSRSPGLEQQMRYESGFHPNDFIGSSNLLASSTYVPFSHPSSSATMQPARSNPMDNVASQVSPPSISSHPLQGSGLSNSTSSKRLSPRHDTMPSQINNSSFRRVTRSPQNLDKVVEFGSMDRKLAHHQFNFPIFDLFSTGEDERQVGAIRPGEETVEESAIVSDVLNHELSFQFQPTSGEEYHTWGSEAGNIPDDNDLQPFQPIFHFDPGSIN